jgi:hypothetical protein
MVLHPCFDERMWISTISHPGADPHSRRMGNRGQAVREVRRGRVAGMAVAVLAVAVLAAALVPVSLASAAGSGGTLTFTTPGSIAVLEVQAGMCSADVVVTGGTGGDGALTESGAGLGGPGGQVIATIPVTVGTNLTVNVGGNGGAGGASPGAGGLNGGGDGGAKGSTGVAAGGGGGRSDILGPGSTALAVAAGGGGGGGIGQVATSTPVPGGDGGSGTSATAFTTGSGTGVNGTVGENVFGTEGQSSGGGAGTGTAAGLGGGDGSTGGMGVGGTGRGGGNGGGGGGFFGGGGASGEGNVGGAGGGGGSSFVVNGATAVSHSSSTDGPSVTITFNPCATASITIIKDALPNDGQDFAYTTTGSGLSNFSLDDDSDAALSNTKTFPNLVAGSYTITEGDVPGWSLTGLTCDTGGTPNLATRTVDITLTTNQNVVCTYSNTKRGSITILADDDPYFLIHTFTYTTTGSGLSDFTAGTTVNSFSPGRYFPDLLPGSYSVAQSALDGWVFTGLSCNTGEAPNVATRSVDITLTPGENVTCTFSNEKLGTITIIENSTPKDAQDFSFTTTGDGLSTFSVDDDSDPTLANTKTFSGLVPGTYSVTENAAPGWALVDLHCNDVSTFFTSTGVPAFNIDTPTATITLTPGTNLTCTFTNAGTPASLGKVVFERKWGTFGESNGQFSGPADVAIDAAGSVYVVEAFNHRVQKFSRNGVFVTKWGTFGTGNGQFQYPQAVAVDAAGNVYVVDGENNRIQKFTSSGAFIAKWGTYGAGDGQFSTPRGIAVDAAGDVYISDTGNNRIQKFTGTGTFLTKWGTFGTGNGQFSFPAAVAVDSAGSLYVADLGNHRVQKLTDMGAFVTKWGTQGTANGQFNYPNDVTVDTAGDVYVTDSNHRVQKFSASGAFLGTWGDEGNADDQFAAAHGVAVDAAGNVYVADLNNARIQKFQQPGSLTVIANSLPDAAQNFTFTFDHGSFTLDDDDDPELDNSIAFNAVEPGSYAITQSRVANWQLTSLVCDTGEIIDLANRRAYVQVGFGEDVTCTFTNAQDATITIVQDAVPDSGQNFSFTGDLGPTFILDDANEMPAHPRQHTFRKPPGTYAVTEGPQAGWSLTGLVCSPTNPTDLGTRTATISVGPGEETTCTFTNSKDATITIDLNTQPDDPQNFEFTGDLGTFVRDNDPGSPLGHSQTFAKPPGTYAVTQTAQAGWSLTSLSCSPAEPTNLGTRTATITVAAGDQTTCTFIDKKDPTITVVLDAQPDDAQDFSFAGGLGTFTLDDDANATLPNQQTFSVAPGTYPLTQNAVAGWPLTALACSPTEPTNLGTRTATITVAAGEQTTCTFTNAKSIQPDALIAKAAAGPYFGDNVYNATGASQSLSSGVARGQTATFFARIQNDSTTFNDQFTLAGTASTGTFTIRYFNASTGAEITNPVKNGTFVTPTLGPRGIFTVRITVVPSAIAGINSRKDVLLTARSMQIATKLDAVKAGTTATRRSTKSHR